MRVKDKCPTITEAIQAMITGLETIPDGKKYRIDMSTFGGVNGQVCYGCAATYAVMQVCGKLDEESIRYLEIRSDYLKISSTDLHQFEVAIDNFRKGRPQPLFNYYSLGHLESLEEMRFQHDWYLGDNNYKEQLPKIKDYLEKLKVALTPEE